jgi:hypothetical protein
LDALEERTLLRGMESYGQDNFALLRSMLLPVHGSKRRVPNVGQVAEKCRHLLLRRKKTFNTLPVLPTMLSSATWKDWIAKDGDNSNRGTQQKTSRKQQAIVADDDEGKIKSKAVTESSTGENKEAVQTRSGRKIKPRITMDC